MTTVAFIALRETAEVSIIICTVLALLRRTNRNDFRGVVWAGVFSGVLGSILSAVLLTHFAEQISLQSKDLYEGIIYLAASALILWTLLWISRAGRDWKNHLERTTTAHILRNERLGLFLLCFTATIREGMEMALLIHATLLQQSQPLHTLAGIAIGITVAMILSALMLYGIRFIPLRHFFLTTGLLLLALGTHLMIEGIETLQVYLLESSHLSLPFSFAHLPYGMGVLYILTIALLSRTQRVV